MPYIGGHELAERLTALRPELKVLFMSGYVDDPVILQAVQDSHIPFLEKTVQPDHAREKSARSAGGPLGACRAGQRNHIFFGKFPRDGGNLLRQAP